MIKVLPDISVLFCSARTPSSACAAILKAVLMKNDSIVMVMMMIRCMKKMSEGRGMGVR
jgi:hypothetical protein